MTRQEFYELIGEWPEDIFGEDWKLKVDEYINNLKDEEYYGDSVPLAYCR